MSEKHDKPQNAVYAQQSNVSCSNCGMNNHQTEDCRRNKTVIQNQDREVTCFYCSESCELPKEEQLTQ